MKDQHFSWKIFFAELVGTALLLLMGRSIHFGVTVPGSGYATSTVLLGEVVTTFTMVSLLIVFLGFRSTRSYTPGVFPILYSIMVPLEAAISGTSPNPARTLGPSVISGVWEGWWIYWIGPLVGAFLASLACSALAKRITEAKLYHFDRDEDILLRRKKNIAAPLDSGRSAA